LITLVILLIDTPYLSLSGQLSLFCLSPLSDFMDLGTSLLLPRISFPLAVRLGDFRFDLSAFWIFSSSVTRMRVTFHGLHLPYFTFRFKHQRSISFSFFAWDRVRQRGEWSK